jgi:hypothetical protein
MSAAAVGAVLLIGATASCGLLGGDDPKRDEPGGQITESSDADVFALQVGDCFNSADLGEQITTVPVVPCSDPHDSEIFAEFALDDGKFPGDSVIEDKAAEYCDPKFTEFFGISAADQNMDAEIVYAWWPMTPTSLSWGTGDRLIQCIAAPYDEGVQITGSIKGLGTAAAPQ